MGNSSRFFVSTRITTLLKIFFKEVPKNNDALQIYAKLGLNGNANYCVICFTYFCLKRRSFKKLNYKRMNFYDSTI